MEFSEEYKPEFSSFKDLLLEMAQERSVDTLLSLIVRSLAARPHVALARIWLRKPGDRCDTCAMAESCWDRSFCLHMVAAEGDPLSGDTKRWRHLGGTASRCPMAVWRRGGLPSLEDPGHPGEVAGDGSWIMRPTWARAEGIRSYGVFPIRHKETFLGVLGIYLRIGPVREGVDWVRIVADHAAISLANARAFEENMRLREQVELENDYLKRELRETWAFGSIVGESPAMQNALKLIDLVAPVDAGVLITGETGTGKELAARAIHAKSDRKHRPFIKVNCASIPNELFESEFFGHVKGAFTGALRDRAGRFEAAHGGVLFLDEVGEMPLEQQGKLLSVLQEGCYERVGEDTTRKVDVRVIAATNRDLQKEAPLGRFRADLYYRLNVIPIDMAPLRMRKEDIPLLARHFLAVTAAKMHRPVPRLQKAHLEKLMNYDWPGNVRELQNLLERAMVISRGGDLIMGLPEDNIPARQISCHDASAAPGEILTERAMREFEIENTRAALAMCDWRVSGTNGAAAFLGIKPTTLFTRMKKMGLRPPKAQP